MYTGLRDPEIRIVVPKTHCYEYIARNKDTYVEVFIPPEKYTDYDKPWGSIMLKPTQVYFVPNSNCNMLMVNDFAQIINSVKDPKRHVISSETLTPDKIIGRELKFWHLERNRIKGYTINPNDDGKPSYDYYKKFDKSGLQMYRYLCKLYEL